MLPAVAAALAAAVLAVLVRRVRSPHPALPPLRAVPLLVLALATQVAAVLLRLGARGQAGALLASYAVAATFLVLNRRRRGFVVIAVGLAANAAVVAANGAMPVSLRAARRAGLDPTALALGADPRHEALRAGTRLRWLGDVVPLPVPALPEVVSAGDLVCAAGVALAVWCAVLAGREAPRTLRRAVPADGPTSCAENDSGGGITVRRGPEGL